VVFIIKGDTKGRVTGTVVAPGGGKYMLAYWGELAGLHVVLPTANIICQYHEIHQGRITIGCNFQYYKRPLAIWRSWRLATRAL